MEIAVVTGWHDRKKERWREDKARKEARNDERGNNGVFDAKFLTNANNRSERNWKKGNRNASRLRHFTTAFRPYLHIQSDQFARRCLSDEFGTRIKRRRMGRYDSWLGNLTPQTSHQIRSHSVERGIKKVEWEIELHFTIPATNLITTRNVRTYQLSKKQNIK